jgi:hypothetical protein
LRISEFQRKLILKGGAMDADSWSARLSSASKRYQSALQSRSGEIFFFLSFGNYLIMLCMGFFGCLENEWKS